MRGSQVHILQGEIVGCDIWMTYGTSDLLTARDRKVDPNCSKQRINLLAQIIVLKTVFILSNTGSKIATISWTQSPIFPFLSSALLSLGLLWHRFSSCYGNLATSRSMLKYSSLFPEVVKILRLNLRGSFGSGLSIKQSLPRIRCDIDWEGLGSKLTSGWYEFMLNWEWGVSGPLLPFPFGDNHSLVVTFLYRFTIYTHLWFWVLYKYSQTADRASLVAQWLGVCLPMQGTRVRALVWEDPTCRGAAEPVSHNYWAWASGACAPQWERPWQWEARAPRWRVAPARHNWRKPSHRDEDPTQPK